MFSRIWVDESAEGEREDHNREKTASPKLR
jgi:hypothetical protein